MDRQYLIYSFSAYASSPYTTDTQKTKLKFPSINVPDYTQTSGIKSGDDPERKGSTYTYGPYNTAKLSPETVYPITVRYELTAPIIAISLLERDVEVSHWGGNLATEERYWMHNNGSKLLDNFSRVQWTLSKYRGRGGRALRELSYPLKPGSVDAYYTDDVGNVTTSHYRPGKQAHLLLQPRFPLFGGWNYSFRVGWNNALSTFLRRSSQDGDTYILKVPFVEGPDMPEGVQYEKVVVRVVLPEGARDLDYGLLDAESGNGLPGSKDFRVTESNLKTYMDTLGRTVLTVSVDNLTDAARNSQLIVSAMLSILKRIMLIPGIQVSYHYTLVDALRKPVTFTAGLLTVFFFAWLVGNIDVSIKKR